MKTKSTIIKYWNERRYLLSNGRWRRKTKEGYVPLPNDIWNLYHPEDLIMKGDGFIIHHINKNTSDDRIENLQKMDDSGHKRLHAMKTNNPAFKDGRTLNWNKYVEQYRKSYILEKCLYSQSDKENHFQYQDIVRINKRTGNIGVSHRWRCYESCAASRD